MGTCWRRFAWLVIVCLLLLMAATVQAEAEPTFSPGPCPAPFPAANRVECGVVTVPQDRLHREERSLSLAVAVFKTSSASPALDPLIFLDGGPGSRTLDSYANGLNSLLAAINQTRDVIVFDYRGIGYSEPALTCPEAVGAADDTWVAECRSRLEAEGVDLTDFTTRDNAADAAAIVRALGYETHNIWGGSYGSSVALTLLRDHPEHVRAAIVTALQPPQGDLQAATPVYILRTLQAVSDLCQANAACATAFPGDLIDELAVVVERLEANPLPITTSGSAGELDGLDVLVAVSELLKDEANIPIIPGLIAALYAEQYDWIMPYADVLTAVTLPPNPYGAWLSMRCTDSILATTDSAIDAALQEIHLSLRPVFRSFHEDQVARCQRWGARVPTESDRLPAVADTPTLIISGTLDPFSSQAWLDSALATLPNGQGYMLPYHMHYVIHQPCAAQMLTGFIDDPSGEVDASCMAGIAAPVFRVN